MMYADFCTWHARTPVNLTGISLPPRKIFVVDDHPLMRKGYRSLFQLEPDLSICDEATGGYEALEKLQNTETDLVITDVSMKDINGFDLTRQIKEEWHELPVLVASSYSREIHASRARQVGARGYIEKSQLATNGVNITRCALTQVACTECPFLFD